MKKKLRDELELLSCPGDTIVGQLEHLKMSRETLAKEMGIDLERVNKIIAADEEIDTEIAIRLQNALGIDSRFWINREKNFRLKLNWIWTEHALTKPRWWRTIAIFFTPLCLGGLTSMAAIREDYLTFWLGLVAEVGLIIYMKTSMKMTDEMISSIRQDIHIMQK